LDNEFIGRSDHGQANAVGEALLSSSGPAKSGSMSRSAAKGFLAVFLTSGLGKLAALGAHLAMGWFLLDEHWGLYSIALSLSVFVEVLRNAGVAQLVVSRGPEGYAKVSGPAFWMAALFNSGACALLISTSSMAVGYYGQPDLAPLLIAVGFSFVLGTPTAILRSKLQVELRFEALAVVAAASSITRATVLVAAAYGGAQVYTFVWGFVIYTACESLFHWLATFDSPWLRTPAIRSWPNLLRNAGSLMVGNFLLKLSGRGDYLVLSVLIGVGLLGQYMFAYELVYQISVLISVNFQAVLFPVLNRLVDDRRRLHRAVERTVSALVMAVAAPAFLFAVLARPLETLLWSGKWATAVDAMEILAVSEPLRGVLVVAHSVLLAQARFEARILLLLGVCASVMLGAFAGGLLFEESLRGIALVGVVVQAIFILTASGLIFKGIGCDLFSLAVSVIVPMIVGSLSAAAAWVINETIFAHYVPLLFQSVLMAGVFVLVFLLLSRLLLHKVLSFVASVMPDGKIRRIYCFVLKLENPTGTIAEASETPRHQ
jgi:O-antigen/teichoic acid export membrane protein